MTLIRDETGRLHIESPLLGESLMRKGLLAETEITSDQVFRPLSDLNVIKIGGQSIIDRGREVLLPILDEIVAARATFQIVVITGGGSRCILVKDERGLFTDDPKRNPNAEFIAEISAEELIARDLPDLPVERTLLTTMTRAKSVHEVYMVNGRERGALTAALRGENAGTRIRRDS